MSTPGDRITQLLDEFRHSRDVMVTELNKVIIGQRDVIELILASIFTRGHVLLVGVPGLAKTLMVSSIARILDVSFKRIQFTPDLMPSDITGTNVLEEPEAGRRSFRFVAGPLFANIILADEINRTPPKTQSALLQAMQEREVTVGQDTMHLPEPFFVIATQNPIEQEGTYPLPEAQLDRFLMKILVVYPSREDLNRIVERTIRHDETTLHQVVDHAAIMELRAACHDVLIAPHVQDFAIDLVMATQPGTSAHALSNKYIRYGSSPRGAQALVECARVLALMRGRLNASVDDIREIAADVLRHRIILNFDAHADGQTPDTILGTIIESVTSAAVK
jgi:MoxR-like ATPase